MKKQLIKEDKFGTKTYKVVRPCSRCGGLGRIDHFRYISGGICFKCNGAGIEEGIEKEFTEERRAQLDAQAKRRAERKAEKELQERLANKEAHNKEFFESHGFNAEGVGYVCVGNTYPKKEEIKANGGKWESLLCVWIMPKSLEGVETVKTFVATIYELSGIGEYLPYINGESCPNFQEEYNSKNTEYVGEIGQKLTITVEIKRIFYHDYELSYGVHAESTLLIMEDDEGHCVTWKASKWLDDVKEGDKITISGKIKDHDTYNGIKQTVLTRCKYTKD